MRSTPAPAGLLRFAHALLVGDHVRVAGATVTIDVRLGARLGPGRRRLTLPAGATVADLLAALADDLGRTRDQLAGVAVALSGEVVGRERVLHDGEALALILPVAGG